MVGKAVIERSETLRRCVQEGLDRQLTDSEVAVFERYLELIARWGRVHRLVGSLDRDWLIENVILDSLSFLQVLPASARDIVDVGSGVGAPGIPLAIVQPELRMTLVEARRRRASFLSTAVRELELSNCRVLGERAEAIEERFDAAVARAAGSPARILPVASRLVRPRGVVVLGGSPHPEPFPGIEWMSLSSLAGGRSRTIGLYRQE